MTEKHTVQIIGGGLAGLSLALALGKKNISTLIVDNLTEPTKADKTDGRTTALMESSVNYLNNLGVWADISGNACALQKMRILNIVPQNKIADSITFDANEIGLPALAYNIDNHILRTALCEKIAGCDGVKHLFKTSVSSAHFENGSWVVKTNNGNFTADLTIGADGRNSIIRKNAGIDTTTKDYNQSAIVFNVKHSAPHHNSSTEFMYSGGAFTFVPMNDNTSAIVWVENTSETEKLINDNTYLQKKFMKKAQNLFGEMEIITPPKSFPLNKVIATTNIAGSLCLMGEAHHGITPVAAQGLNLSLRDSAILAELITTNGTDNKMLSAYNRKRLHDIKTRIIGTETFHMFSRQNDPISLGIKSIATKLLNRLPVAKNKLIEIGLSFPGGTPAFMKRNNSIF